MRLLEEIIGKEEDPDSIDLLEKARSEIAEAADTTGSKLHDGLIVLYGKDLIESPSIVQNYERIAAELRGKKGQPVLFIYRQPDYEKRWRDAEQLRPVSIKTSVAVGVLAGEELEFDYNDGMCRLPTARHVYDSHPRKPSVQTAGVAIAYPSCALRAYDLGYDLDTPLEEGFKIEPWEYLPESYRGLAVMSLAIGDEGIARWLTANDSLRTNHELGVARELCEALEIEKIAPVTFDQRLYLEVV